MFQLDPTTFAEELLDTCRRKNLKVATVESCTGGLVAALLTSIAGSSDVVERGFVTYSNEAKIELLGVPEDMLRQHGAVSREVSIAMAEGGLAHSKADLCVAVTGVAGPGGGTIQKPAGLVHIAVVRRGYKTIHHERRFGDRGRSQVRNAAVVEALSMLRQMAG